MKAKVIHKNQETYNTISIRYELAETMHRKPGHFVMMDLEVEQEGKKKIIKRAYSMSSTPQDPYIETAVKLEGIGSNTIHKLNPGDEIEITGPYGHFLFEENMEEVVLIGAGSGITPLMSVIRHINQKNLKTKTMLIYSNKTPEDIVYKNELEELNNKENINCHFTITRSETSETKWEGLTGRIDSSLVKKLVKDINTPYFFLCGPPSFVEGIKVLLLEEGVEKEKIKQERFGSED